jgi:hypothetical protein
VLPPFISAWQLIYYFFSFPYLSGKELSNIETKPQKTKRGLYINLSVDYFYAFPVFIRCFIIE